jgi:transmembrane sensor
MSTSPSNPAEQRVRREAAVWLTKHDRGLTAAEQDEFFQWLAADARHGAWYSRHRAGWQRLDGIAEWRPENGVEPNPDVLARPVRRSWWLRPLALSAMAAGLALAAGALWLLAPWDPSTTTIAATHADAGGYERRVLDDGSVAELNRGAEIEVNYTAAERRIVLRRGEALFTVAKNPSRPFVVRARGVDVRAVGTAFNVRLDTTSIEVLVTEGKVEVAPPSASSSTRSPGGSASMPLVAAGERAIIPLSANAAPQIARTTAAELARVRAWQPQLLDFSSVPLEQVLAELNRRNRVQLVLAAPASARVPIVASIRSDNIEGFVTLVATAAGLRPEHRGDYEIVLHAAK